MPATTIPRINRPSIAAMGSVFAHVYDGVAKRPT